MALRVEFALHASVGSPGCALLKNGGHAVVVSSNSALFHTIVVEDVALFEGTSEDCGRKGEDSKSELGERRHFV